VKLLERLPADIFRANLFVTINPGDRRNRTHAAGIGTLVAIMNRLVVLSERE